MPTLLTFKLPLKLREHLACGQLVAQRFQLRPHGGCAVGVRLVGGGLRLLVGLVQTLYRPSTSVSAHIAADFVSLHAIVPKP